MTTCADIFKAMPGRFNAEAAGDWQTSIRFEISGEGGGTWTMEVKDGVCSVTDGPSAAQPKATVKSDAPTWIGVNTGTVNPMQAFMTGKIKVEGNMGELMKLNNPAVFKRA